FNQPMKFVIPNRIIPAHGYTTFSEEDFNPGGHGFAFSSKGDQVYLFSGDGTNLTGYVHGFDFGPAFTNMTFGRYVTSGGEQFVAQLTPTLGQTNSPPRVGPVVISEIMYRPADQAFYGTTFNNVLDEYIELQNITGTNVALYDVSYPTNTWHLRNAVDFDF